MDFALPLRLGPDETGAVGGWALREEHARQSHPPGDSWLFKDGRNRADTDAYGPSGLW